MSFVITGNPGVGKHTVAERLSKKIGYKIIDINKIANGIMLEDGLAKVDNLSVLKEGNEVGIEIHIGKNRIVKRIFESLGYEVIKLDRVVFAGLTKKDLPRGKWRLLKPQELRLLKHF